jgi:acetyl esterase
VALDAETAQLLNEFATSGAKPIAEMTVEEARGLTGQLAELYGSGPEMAKVEDGSIPASGGAIPYRLLSPSANPKGVIIYYHGGGWVIGNLPDFDVLGRELADRTGCAVILVDYRMAPEYRFPTAVDDSWEALRWVDGHLDEIAGRRVPIVLAGDSAGGNLTAVVAQRAKAAGGPPILLQVLVYPVTDCNLETASYLDPDNQLLVDRPAMIWFWDHYAPLAASREHPDASPLRTDDYRGLPPAAVLTAEHDVLRDEGEQYAARLEEAGVPVKQLRVPGQMHGFFTMVNVLPGNKVGIEFVVDAIGSALTGAGESA